MGRRGRGKRGKKKTYTLHACEVKGGREAGRMEIHITHAAFRNKVGQVCKRLELLGEVVHTHALYRQKTTTRKPNAVILLSPSQCHVKTIQQSNTDTA